MSQLPGVVVFKRDLQPYKIYEVKEVNWDSLMELKDWLASEFGDASELTLECNTRRSANSLGGERTALMMLSGQFGKLTASLRMSSACYVIADAERAEVISDHKLDKFAIRTTFEKFEEAMRVLESGPASVITRELLSKYIQHVGECEGSTFLSATYRNSSSVKFTDDEWEALDDV